jgi:AAA15 family ATPase/GTPase
MLVEFRVENHRSIREEQVFTMEADRGDKAVDDRPRDVIGSTSPLLPLAALYGANASGKSNILDAIHFVRLAVLHSHRNWDPAGGVPRNPFAWDGWPEKPSLFEQTIISNGIKLQLGFVVDDTQILEEWLYAWPKGRKQIWYEREWDDGQYRYHYGDHLKGERKIVEEVTRPNALFLSAAAQHGIQQITSIYEWFWDLRTINLQHQRHAFHHHTADTWLSAALARTDLVDKDKNEVNAKRLETFLDLIRAADVGITNIKKDPANPGSYLFRHRHSASERWLAFDEESDGTKNLIWRSQPLLDALWSGGLVIVDELERSLHPLLAQRIVDLFQNPESNPNHSQIIFTTHDTNLLAGMAGAPSLRRDQVWLTEKSRDDATHLLPLSSYKPRKAENLERGYLMGRYGGIPITTSMRGAALLGKATPLREPEGCAHVQ